MGVPRKDLLGVRVTPVLPLPLKSDFRREINKSVLPFLSKGSILERCQVFFYSLRVCEGKVGKGGNKMIILLKMILGFRC